MAPKATIQVLQCQISGAEKSKPDESKSYRRYLLVDAQVKPRTTLLVGHSTVPTNYEKEAKQVLLNSAGQLLLIDTQTTAM